MEEDTNRMTWTGRIYFKAAILYICKKQERADFMPAHFDDVIVRSSESVLEHIPGLRIHGCNRG